uniref:Laccase n=1 Tax=Cyberlindnera americana TaxID=36016 RepID=A0A5P8N8V5_9ASCO|nr:laccase [Cyberlindnera americana]
MLFSRVLTLAGLAFALPNQGGKGNKKEQEVWQPEDVIPQNANVITYEWNLTVESRNLDGNYRETFLINGQMPGPMITGNQGDWVVINVHNYLTVPTTIHFHGIHNKKTPFSDGAAGITQWPILSGDSYQYVFELDQYGMYWYHSHYRGYSNDGIIGPIYIVPGEDVERPYSEIVSSDEVALLEELEKSPQTLMFSDWFKDTYDSVASKMFSFGMDPTCIRTMLTNGKGRHICMDSEVVENESTTKTTKLQSMAGTTSTNIDKYGCLDLETLNGFTSIDYDKSLLYFPGYNTECVNATTDYEIIYTNDQNYIMLNLLNAGGEFSKMLSIDDHNITAIAVDGNFIQPMTGQQLYLPIGQRVTAIVETDSSKHDDVTNPFAIRTACNDMPQIIEGIAYLQYGYVNSTNATGIQNVTYPEANGVQFQNRGADLLSDDYTLINPGLSSPYNTSLKPPTGPADHTIYLYLNRLGATTFSIINNVTMSAGMELDEPALFVQKDHPYLNLTEEISETLIDVGIEYGDVVDIIFQNSALADHPMHLHGHSFWSLVHNDSIVTFPYSSVEEAINDGAEDMFDFETAPYVDGVAVITGGYNVIRLVADNPGVWMIHCHIQTHISAGMSAAFVSIKDQIGVIPKSLTLQAHADYDSMDGLLVPSELNVTLT